MGKLKNVAVSVPETGVLVTPLSRILNAMGLRHSHRLGRAEYVRICEEAALDSLGLEPDPRFTELVPRKGERVAIFRISEPKLAVSVEFREAAAVLALGVVVAHADGELSPDEKDEIEAHRIDNASLSEDEDRRLQAWVEWLLASAPRVHSAVATARELFADQPAIDREEVAAMALRIASSDGIISLSEMDTLQRIYSALGLSNDKLQHNLAMSDQVVVQEAQNDEEATEASQPATRPDQVSLLMDVLFN